MNAGDPLLRSDDAVLGLGAALLPFSLSGARRHVVKTANLCKAVLLTKLMRGPAQSLQEAMWSRLQYL